MPLASPTKPQGRSAVTNGRTLLPGVDGRGAYARRLRDVMAAHLSEASRSVAMLMRHSLIRRRNSLFSRENSLFDCVGNFAATT